MDRANYFEYFCFDAATSGIFTHAFLIAEGNQNRDPVVILSQNQCATGLVGVFVFFVISGFLVTQSWEQTNSLPRFLAKRALRIYPGFAVCILVLTFGLCAAMTTLPVRDYLADPGTQDFLTANLSMQLQPNALPDVKFSELWFGTVMDGPLWSLPLEAALYLMVAVLGITRLIRLPVLAVLMAIGLVSVWFDKWIDKNLTLGFIGGVAWMLPFFVAGMALYKLRDRGIFNGRLALLAVIGVVARVPLQSFLPLFAGFGGFLPLYPALHPNPPGIPAPGFGDLSSWL